MLIRFGEFGFFSLFLSLSWFLRDSFSLLLLTIGSDMCAVFRQESGATFRYKIFGSVEMTKVFFVGDITLSGSSTSDSFDQVTRHHYLDKDLIQIDQCKRDLKALDINIQCWEDMAADRNSWRSTLQRQLKAGEEQIQTLAEEKRARRKACTSEAVPATIHTCVRCGKVCQSWKYHGIQLRAHHPWWRPTDRGHYII